MSPVAVVTGGSSGIGQGAAVALAARGFDVGVTWSQNEAGAQETVAAIDSAGRRGASVELDLRETQSIEARLRELASQLGAIDVLVCNAGMNRRCDAIDETEEAWDKVLAVNLTGPWLCSRAVAKDMIGRGAGRIIFVSSIVAGDTLSGAAAYCAAKAGVEALARVLALELAPHGVLVNSVAPGHTATPMNFAESVPEAYSTQRPVIPLGRPADPAEVAAAIAFLASNEASYLTGSTLLVDGGLRLVSGPESLQRATGRPPERKGSA